MMGGRFYFALMVLLWSGGTLNAAQSPGSQQVQGTVVEVQKHRMQFPDYAIGGSNPSDAPLTSRYYVFEVAVRIDCMTYFGRYETALNYLPGIFTSGQKIRLRLTKHGMYFDLPNDPDFRMGIVHRRKECGVNR